MKSTRRQWGIQNLPLAASALLGGPYLCESALLSKESERMPFQYLLASCLYGYEPLAKILPEVRKTGTSYIDIWPMVHGNQREQIDELGEDSFRDLIVKSDVQLGCITQYKLGPFGLKNELNFAKRFGCQTIVTGAQGPAQLSGTELKQEVKRFIELMKPHIEIAESCGVVIAIENHSNSLIQSPDSLKYLAEMRTSRNLAIAFAPYHLPQRPSEMANLLSEILPAVEVFYAWEHGHGCMTKLPKEEELMQLPGRGEFDFQLVWEVLLRGKFARWVEVFMHPYPRGVAILDSVGAVTEEINRSRMYLESLSKAPKE